MKDFNYLEKELVKTFYWSSINTNRESQKDVCIDGRWYIKLGVEQAVTFAGKLYKSFNSKLKLSEYVLHVGIAKQHPEDFNIDKNVAFEIAQENALMNPSMIIKVNRNFKYSDFEAIVIAYFNSMSLKFVKTRQEVKAQENAEIYFTLDNE